MRRHLDAALLWLWHGTFFALGMAAGLLWTVILVAVVAARAGYAAGRYR